MAGALLWLLQRHQHRPASIISVESSEGPGTPDFILATIRIDLARCVVCHCTMLYHRLGNACFPPSCACACVSICIQSGAQHHCHLTSHCAVGSTQALQACSASHTYGEQTLAGPDIMKSM